MKNLTVIIPAFNECESIGTTIKAVRSIESDLHSRGVELQICIIDDGSSDSTADIAKAEGAERVISHRVNRGLGAAIRSGLNSARDNGADLVIKFDADLQHDPEDIPAMLDPILKDEADVVYGNRFRAIQYRMPIVRRLGNYVFTAIMRWLTKWPLHDSQPGIFGVGKPYLERFFLPGDYNYTQQLLLDAYHKGMRFTEVPVSFRERESGTSFVSLRYPFIVLPQIFLLLVSLRPLKVFGPVGSCFLLIGVGVFVWDLAHWALSSYPDPAEHVNAVLGFTLFGIQTLFFGVLAHLIIQQTRH